MKVNITMDEWYLTFIREATEYDEGCPQYYTVIEIPDEKYEQYVEAIRAFHTVRNEIIKEYGESIVNPNWREEMDEYIRIHDPDEYQEMIADRGGR